MNISKVSACRDSDFALVTPSEQKQCRVAKVARRAGRVRLEAWASLLSLTMLALIFLAGCKGGNSAAITITIGPSSSPSVDQGQPYFFTATIANDTQNKGVTWTINTTGCSGVGCGALSSATPFTVTYTAPTNLTAAQSVTITATSVTNNGVTATATVNVVIPPMFTTGTSGTELTCAGPCQLANAQNGIPYTQTITATDGITPLIFSLKSGGGTLPPGLTLNPSGVIVGTPSSPTVGNPPQTYVFTAQVTDNGTPPLAITQQFSITAQPPTALSITTSGTLAAGFTNGNYSARVSASGGTPPLTWSIVGGAAILPPGLAFSSTTGQITGVPTTPGTYPFKVQVQDASIPQQTVTTPSNLSITIQAPPPLTISSSSILPAGATATPYSTLLLATGGIPPFTWTLTSGQLPPGLSLGPDGTLSGTPVWATTPPAIASFTAQVTDSEVSPQTATQTFSLTINQGASGNSLLSGQYSFLFKGFDANGPLAIVGSLVADGNGNITAGVEDSNRLSSSGVVQVVNAATLFGTYTINSDGRGTLELTSISPTTSVTLTTDYRLVIDSAGNVRFFENNQTTTNTDTLGTHGEGMLKHVSGSTASSTSTSSFSASNFSGNYSFGFSGQDLNGKAVALAGAVNANGDSTLTVGGSGPNSDFNDAGAFSSQNVSGTFAVQSTSNRGSATIVFEVPSKGQFTLTFNFYFVGPNDLYFVEVDSPQTTTLTTYFRLSGEMLLQQSAYQFTRASLVGASVATGTATGGANASVFAGLLTSATADSATFSYDENNGGAIAGPSFSGTYSIAPNGRVVFAGFGSRLVSAYLTGPAQGFLIGNDTAVTLGRLEQQTLTAFPATVFQGQYTLGTAAPGDNKVPNLLGELVASGAVAVTGTVDAYDPPSTANPEGLDEHGENFNGTINSLSASTGRGVLQTNFPTDVPQLLDFYVVSPGVVRAIPADASVDTHPQVILFDH